jgi:hypothetical protein
MYKKYCNKNLFKSLEKFDIMQSQNYIPIYGNWFSLNASNWNNINLNQRNRIIKIEEKLNNNKFRCTVEKPGGIITEQTLFFKFSPLLDPTKFMIGKYKDIHPDILSALPTLTNSNICEKVRDKNNAAYVDSFFSYLTSQTLHEHNFAHGLDFFGSYLSVKKNFYFNIADDVEFLYESDFFHEHKGKLFEIDDMDKLDFAFPDTRKKREKITINPTDISLQTEQLDVNTLDSIFKTSDEIQENSNLIFEFDLSDKTKKSMSKTSSTCSSRSSNTSLDTNDSVYGSGDEGEGDEGDEGEGGDDDDEDDSSYDENESSGRSETSSLSIAEFLGATVKNFPVEVICLEEMEETLDSFLEMSKLSQEEWISCLFQVIIQLITYQKLFDLTHNDLHTNNIMYVKTDKPYLYYKYEDKHYKVPTHGKIYKIIDFGRAIYKFKGNIICSDSFHPKGDAATQYNCEPYFNNKKPRLEPNASFDLCRLGCSLYDFFVDEEELNSEEPDPLTLLIIEWARDDKNRNILYKNNGDERYPDFKLYKMIARTVHKHTPRRQLENPLFKQFCVSRKKINRKAKIFNIDKLPSYVD